MTATPVPRQPSSVLTTRLVLLLLCALGGFLSFYLLLSAVPQYAAQGWAGSAGAGMATGALMLTTVAIQPPMPKLLSRLGYRAPLLTSMALLGLPALVLLLSSNLWLIMVVSLVRGFGVGMFVVAANAVVPELVPACQRSRGSGWFGVASGLGGAVGIPFGVWLVHEFGYPTVFVIGAAAPVAGFVAACGVVTTNKPDIDDRPRVLAGIARWPVARPFLLLTACTIAIGVVVTFLPVATPSDLAWLASVGLLVAQLAVTGSRWIAGKIGDRYGNDRLLVPASLLAGVGVLGGIFVDNQPAFLLLMGCFGIGFGLMQNATMVLMLHRSPTGYGTASAQWNLAFDIGTGIGGLGFGVFVDDVGFSAAFVASAVLLLAMSSVALIDSREHDDGRRSQPRQPAALGLTRAPGAAER